MFSYLLGKLSELNTLIVEVKNQDMQLVMNHNSGFIIGIAHFLPKL